MTEWIAIVTITVLAVISPGPDFAMISRNAISLSRRAGFLTSLGIGAGVLVHVSYALIGLEVVGRYADGLLSVIKFLGACYLIWLGLKLLTNRPSTKLGKNGVHATSDFYALRIGFLTNVLNPKTSIFIVSLFTQVVDIDTPIGTQVAYGVFISLAHVLWFSVVAMFFGSEAFGRRLFALRRWLDLAFGLALVGFGAGLLLTDLGTS